VPKLDNFVVGVKIRHARVEGPKMDLILSSNNALEMHIIVKANIHNYLGAK